MRRITFFALAVAIAATSLTSCLKDQYENIKGWQYIGNFHDGDTTTIYSDNGLILKITDRSCGGKLKDYERVVFICDILKKVGEDGYTYNCKLTGFAGVRVAATVKSNDVGSLDPFGKDAVSVHSKWFSAGYINILASVSARKANVNDHSFSLILDEGREDPDNALIFLLRHNANGDVPTEETKEDFSNIGFYLSFTLDNIEYTGETRFKVEWETTEDEADKTSAEEEGSKVKSGAGLAPVMIGFVTDQSRLPQRPFVGRVN